MHRLVEKIVIHCSDSDYEFQTADWIKKIHMEEKKFATIGYHYFIRFDGYLERGRVLDECGAHVYGHNRDSVGICLAGKKDFRKEQFDVLTTLLILLKRIYPTASLYGHNQLNSNKTCPNFDMTKFFEFWKGTI